MRVRLPAFIERMIQPAVTPQDIRSEIYFLGSRHKGDALAGAMSELESGVGPERRRLLQGVVSHLKRSKR
jgi:hypothetical protein